MNEDLNSLWTSVSNKFDVGSFEEFSAKMQTTEQRKSFFDGMVAQDVDLGDYNQYEARLGKTTDPASGTDSGSDDGGLVYEYQTPDKVKFPDAVPEWGKSTDGGKTFEVVEAGNIPEEWFEDPKFTEVYKKENEGFEGEEDPKSKSLKAIWESDYGGMFGGLTTKLAASASALWESIKDPEERAQIKENAINIKNDIPLHLANAWQQTQAFGLDYLRKNAGDDATDFLLGGDKGSIIFIDPDNNEDVSFNDNPDRWKELNSLDAKKGVDIKSISV